MDIFVRVQVTLCELTDMTKDTFYFFLNIDYFNMYIFYLISTSVRNVLAANVFCQKLTILAAPLKLRICLYYYFLIIPREIKKITLCNTESTKMKLE